MKGLLVLMAASLLVVAIAFAQQSPKTTTQSPGRFSLVQGEVPPQVPTGGKDSGPKTVFVIDTQTGQVWEYAPTTVLTNDKGEKSVYQEHFYPVAYGKASIALPDTDRPR